MHVRLQAPDEHAALAPRVLPRVLDGGVLAVPHVPAGVVAQKCPACGYRHESTSQLNGDGTPQPGDWTICFGCATPLIYDDQVLARIPSPTDVDAFLEDKEAVRLVARVQRALRGRRPP